MWLSGVIGAGLLLVQAAHGYTVDPPTTAPSDTIQDCTNWIVAQSTDKCADVALGSGISQQQLTTYNPSLAKNGCKFTQGLSYCVEQNWSIEPETTTVPPTSTGISTPAPIQTGMVKNCNAFYKVQSGDNCFDLAAANHISLSDFYAWNPAVQSDCRALQIDVYVCIGIAGGATATATATTTGNGVSTPTPTQTGMVANCLKFHLVKSGDNCQDIANTNGIALTDFYRWNPAVGSSCGFLQLGYNVCVAVIGGTTAKPTATNGISTPGAIQTGMATNCNKFYLVKSGDGCQPIASAANIALSDFYAWNPAVGSTCTNLIANNYVCIGIIGGTTAKPTATNGISTPGAIQTGMATNCNKFYLVKSGDGCQPIASAANIALSEFYAWNPAVGSTCTSLIANTYVCIGIIGGTTTKPTATNGVSTPGAIQTGMVTNCNRFRLVKSGDSCSQITTAENIALSDFYAWNPAVGKTCTSLIVNTYVCVGIIGQPTSSRKPSSTTKGNGISTPTPVSAMVGNCNKFKQVVSGDTCQKITSSNGISLQTFYNWNSGVGSQCQSLIIGYWVCIGTL